MVMPWVGHICITEGALCTERKEQKRVGKKMEKSMDVFWVCNKPQLHSSPCNGHFQFLFQYQDSAEKGNTELENPRNIIM